MWGLVPIFSISMMTAMAIITNRCAVAAFRNAAAPPRSNRIVNQRIIRAIPATTTLSTSTRRVAWMSSTSLSATMIGTPETSFDDGKGPFEITTPIYYVNDKPHIGHAYTNVGMYHSIYLRHNYTTSIDMYQDEKLQPKRWHFV